MSQAFAAAGSIVAQQTVKPGSTIICARSFVGTFGSSSNFSTSVASLRRRRRPARPALTPMSSISAVAACCCSVRFTAIRRAPRQPRLTITIDGAGAAAQRGRHWRRQYALPGRRLLGCRYHQLARVGHV